MNARKTDSPENHHRKNQTMLSQLLFLAILGTAIIIDPVTQFVFANPLYVLKRLLFTVYYLVVTDPRIIVFVSRRFPMWSMEFYFKLLLQYRAVFPEIFDENGAIIKAEDQE